MRQVLISIALIRALAIPLLAQDISITLQLSRSLYCMGNRFEATVGYTNVSNHDVRLLPDLPIYPASRLQMIKLQTSRKPQFVPIGDVGSLDSEALAKTAQLLKPGKRCRRIITADVTSSLPDFYQKHEHGLYLVFSGHALKLPGFGKYKINALLDSPPKSAEAELVEKLFGPPPLWVGTEHSRAIIAEFRK